MEHLNVVISGFDPYEGIENNPSHVVPHALANDGLGDASALESDDILRDVDISINAVDLPVNVDECWPQLKETLEAMHPDIVVATGLKAAARGILLERCANNIIDTSHSTILGTMTGMPVDASDEASRKPIDSNGPAAFWTRLPLRSILDDFASEEIPSALSSDAGTFVCNSLFYNLMKWTAAQHKVLSGFVSLPIINEEPHPQHGLTLAQQVEACRVVVRQTGRYFLEPTSSNILIA